jgi:virulence-associated protein VapD
VSSGRSYAITVDIDGKSADACAQIDAALARHGFTRRSGTTYFGDERINAVTCVLATIDLARALPWFAAAVRDIRMLRIEELNDLMPAVRQAGSE